MWYQILGVQLPGAYVLAEKAILDLKKRFA